MRKLAYSFIILFVFSILLCEVFMRIYYFQIKSDSGFAIVDVFLILNNKKNSFTDFSKITHIRHRSYPPYYKEVNNSFPYKLETDSNGFIYPVKYYDNPYLKIVFLGGSTTECKYVEDTLRFPYLVGIKLENRLGKEITSINSGVCGSNTMHAVNLLVNRILPIKPDYVVLMENVNDWSTLGMEGTYWNNNVSLSLTYQDYRKAWFIDVDEYKSRKKTKIKRDFSKMKVEYENALHTFISICNANHIKPILMTQAHRFIQSPPQNNQFYNEFKSALPEYGITYEEVVHFQTDFNEVIRKVAKETNTYLIDLDMNLSYKDEYMYDIIHYNNLGSKRVGEIVTDFFSKNIF